jgi:hypothetical protein
MRGTTSARFHASRYSRSIQARIRFLRTRPPAKPEGRPVEPPYQLFQNTQAEALQLDDGFYLRALGDYPLLQFGDQYAAIYRPRALAAHGSAVVKIENPNLRTNWVGRTGLMVRNRHR